MYKRQSITTVSNEITQTVNKKLEDQSAAIQQIQKVQVDTNNNLTSMWAVDVYKRQGEMRVGSRVASQEISTADEGDGGQVVVIGR